MKKTKIKDIANFRESLKNVISMLVSCQIPVVEKGSGAYVQYSKETGKPLLISIPSIPDDASESFLMAIRGFIDHEVAHILFTEPKLGSGYLWNAVEDVFIEKKMGTMFRGSKANLMNTQNHIINTVFIPREEEAIAGTMGDQHRMFLVFYLVPVLRAWTGQTPFVDFMESRWGSIEHPVSVLVDAGVDRMVNKLTCTADCVAVAALIANLLIKEKHTPDDAEGSSSSSPSEPESEDESEPESESGDESEDKESVASDDAEDEETEEPEIPAMSASDTTLLDSIKPPKAAMDMSIEGALKEIISKEIGTSTGYRPYERTYDFTGRLEDAKAFMDKVISKNPDRFNEMYCAPCRYSVTPRHADYFDHYIKPLMGDGLVATLSKDLERAISSQNRKQYIPGQRRGKLHGPSLHRLSMHDDRVFRQLHVKKSVNSCVQIVIDLSGSMRGDKINTACAAAYTLAEALSRISVKTLISGFTTYTNSIPGIGREFNRSEALFLPVMKHWDSSITDKQVIMNLGAICGSVLLAENVDGESIATLMQHFSGRQEDRKIMIVLSDGEPACHGYGMSSHLKEVVRQIETETDINLLAIGVETDAPRQFYSNNICISTVEELSKTLIKEIQKMVS